MLGDTIEHSASYERYDRAGDSNPWGGPEAQQWGDEEQLAMKRVLCPKLVAYLTDCSSCCISDTVSVL